MRLPFGPSLCAFCVFGLALVLLSCGMNDVADDEPDPVVCTTPFQPKASVHQVVGFYPWYRHDILPPHDIRWDNLTRVVYAFAVPTATGELDFGRLTLVDELVAGAHANGVEVFLSVGGGGLSDEFPVLASESTHRSKFVTQIRDYLGTHCLDGVDIDWEAWTKDAAGRPVESQVRDLVTLLTELRSELQPLGLEISIDVYAGHWGGQHYDDSVVNLVDLVQVMAYDFSGPWSAQGPHSSYEQAIGSGSTSGSTGLAYWTGFRAWPKTKIILGVPFYGRDFDLDGGGGVTYREIVARFPNASETDRVANIYYNSPATIRRKAQHVADNSYQGVMIWEIAQDTTEAEISLLQAIDDVLQTSK